MDLHGHGEAVPMQTERTNQMKHTLSKTLLCLSILVTASAYAADGYVTGSVYLRAGPDPGYPSVAMLDAGTPVAIEGCVDGWSWCDVDAGGNRGWVEGTFLQDDYRGQRVFVPQYGVQIGIPIISFVFATYWQDHYRNRSWYSQRAHWSQVQPRYQAVAVRDDSHGNAHGRPNTPAASHDAAPRTRGESNRAAVVAAPAHEAEPARKATRQRSVATNSPAVSHTQRSVPTAHHAAAPRSEALVSHAANSHQAVQPRTMVARHETARPTAQQKKQSAKSKSDQAKHPDGSGSH